MNRVTCTEVIKVHRQLKLRSCGAWGVEFLLKFHGKTPWDIYPLQTSPESERLGFGSIEQETLGKNGIFTLQEERELDEFIEVSKNEYDEKRPVIFSFPEAWHRIETSSGPKLSVDAHIWVACFDGAVLVPKSNSYPRGVLSQIDNIGSEYERFLRVVPKYKIQYLRTIKVNES